MTAERTRALVAKALDGDITAVEREELERLLRADPAARRQLASWSRVEDALKASQGGAPPLDRAGLAARIVSARPESPAPSRRVDAPTLAAWRALSRSPASLTLRRALPIAVAVASIAAFGTLAGTRLGARRGTAVAVAKSEPPAKRVPEPERRASAAPVEIFVGDPSGKDEREYTPVTIRF